MINHGRQVSNMRYLKIQLTHNLSSSTMKIHMSIEVLSILHINGKMQETTFVRSICLSTNYAGKLESNPLDLSLQYQTIMQAAILALLRPMKKDLPISSLRDS